MERLTFEGDFCDIAQCAETRGGSFCESGACSQRQVWERLKAYEGTGLTPEEVGVVKEANRRLGVALAKAEADLAENGDCNYCQYWQNEHCTMPKDQAMGGSCFTWRGKEVRSRDAEL